MLRGKFVAISAYIKKHGRSQIDNITLQLADLEKEKQTKVKAGRRKKISKSKVEINEIENSKIEKDSWNQKLFPQKEQNLQNFT